jgi:N-acetylmuramoyl-L-alanine amidase
MIKFFIDPGHGGIDWGAIGNGLKEKDLTLDISRKIQFYLLMYKDVEVKLSRTKDMTLSLKQRTDMANKWGADFLYSIHINAGGGHGYEDFIHNNLSNTSTTAKKRDIIHAEIAKVLEIENRGKKKENFHMLRESDMTAVLTESGFIDSKVDSAKLKSNAYLDKIAKGHVNGLVKAYNLKLKDTSITYKIKAGDTLTAIAIKHDVTVDDIMKANTFIKKANEINAGDTIKIPKK